ncbi:MAG TPA: 3-isopropylmalate dehydratase small subunit [Stellaceae bacterium]|nr:3-isopropylmalate dehydratase small subunit [Stellaceae bacterium]
MTSEPVIRLTGIAAPLLRDNVDTDQIIPSRAIRLQKAGLGRSLFAAWRYSDDAGCENPEFVLNREAYRRANFLIGGANFGCGSSREAAVWALKDFGFAAILAESFGNIFYANCIANGLVPVALERTAVSRLAALAEDVEGRDLFRIDVESCTVHPPDGSSIRFFLPVLYRRMLVSGKKMIDVVLEHEDEIEACEQRNRAEQPWLVPVR